MSRSRSVRLGAVVATTVAVCAPVAPAASAALPDNRAYELVTPTEKNGLAPIDVLASANGEALDWQTLGALEGATEDGLNLFRSQRTPSEWRTTVLTPEPVSTLAPFEEQAPVFVTADLSKTVFTTPEAFDAEESDAGYLNLYLQSQSGSLDWISRGSPPPGAHGSEVTFDGATQTAGEIAFSSEEPLTANTELQPAGDSPPRGYLYLRNVNSEATTLIDVDDSERLVSTEGAILGNGGDLLSSERPAAGFAAADATGTTTNAISADGTKVFFESPPPHPGPGAATHLYMRNLTTANTVALDDPADAEASATYAGASQSGSRVFFTSQEGLAGAPNDDTELYERTTEGTETEPVRDLSAGERPAEPTEGHVVGVTAIANEGQRVYFVARGVLTHAANPLGHRATEATEGAPKLYLYDTTTGQTDFVATLGQSDVEDAEHGPGGLVAEPDIDRPAVPTPDGSVLVFASSADLTGENTEQRHAEIYRYQAPEQSAAGLLECLSCTSTGIPPTGSATLGPGTGGGSYAPPGRATPLSESGTEIFFASPDRPAALAGEALNDGPEGSEHPMRVYEWEHATGTAPQVALISPAASNAPATLDGTTPTGGDVFFTTAAALVTQDADGGYADVYDARVDGGIAAPQSAGGSCAGPSCRDQIVVPAVFGTLATEAPQAGEPLPRPVTEKPHRKHHKKPRKRRAHRKRARKASAYGRHHSNPPAGAGAPGSAAPSAGAPNGTVATHTDTTAATAAAGTGVFVKPRNPSAAAGGALGAVGAGLGLPGRRLRPAGAPFGISDFELTTEASVGGADASQAGAHPNVTASFGLEGAQNNPPREVVVELPPGLLGNPQSAPPCTAVEFQASACKPSAQVGVLRPEVSLEGGLVPLGTVPVFNLTPSPGRVATLGIPAAEDSSAPLAIAVLIQLSLRRVGSEYGLTATMSDLSTLLPLARISLTLWGVPGQAGHDSERYGPSGKPGQPVEAGVPERPFMTNPTACTDQPLAGELRIASWATQSEPSQVTEVAQTLPAITGCQRLSLTPSLAVQASPAQADSPAEYAVKLNVAQNTEPSELATADLKEISVALPPGTSLTPSAANDLQSCTETQLDSEACPATSTIGAVTIGSPLAAEPLQGSIYLAQPQPDDPYRIFVAASGSAIHLTLVGEIAADPHTGQLTVEFRHAPQLPVAELDLRFFGGPLAVLATPPTCVATTADAAATSWAEPTEQVGIESPFSIQQTSSGGACQGAVPFSAHITAGAASTLAGAFSPFSVAVTRSDGEQTLKTIAAQLPAGELANLAGVPQCQPTELAGATPSCPAASQVGSVTVQAGAGSGPLTLTGAVYITGPYRDAPFGLAMVVPIETGPWELETIVLRAQLQVNPTTLALTIVTDPLPQLVDGIPLRVRAVAVNITRQQFMFNPTNCSPQHVAATLESATGANATGASPFYVAGCSKLAFKPTLTAAAQAGRGRGAVGTAQLTVRIRTVAGQANLRALSIALPERLRPRLAAIAHACRQTTFQSDPYSCPPESVVGSASITTPVLGTSLAGLVYVVSHGAASLPGLTLTLEGEGVHLDVPAIIAVARSGAGRVTATFQALPDVPISTLALTLPAGPNALLGTAKNICTPALSLPYTLSAQNGMQRSSQLSVAATGCPRAHRHRRTKRR